MTGFRSPSTRPTRRHSVLRRRRQHCGPRGRHGGAGGAPTRAVPPDAARCDRLGKISAPGGGGVRAGGAIELGALEPTGRMPLKTRPAGPRGRRNALGMGGGGGAAAGDDVVGARAAEASPRWAVAAGGTTAALGAGGGAELRSARAMAATRSVAAAQAMPAGGSPKEIDGTRLGAFGRGGTGRGVSGASATEAREGAAATGVGGVTDGGVTDVGATDKRHRRGLQRRCGSHGRRQRHQRWARPRAGASADGCHRRAQAQAWRPREPTSRAGETGASGSAGAAFVPPSRASSALRRPWRTSQPLGRTLPCGSIPRKIGQQERVERLG